MKTMILSLAGMLILSFGTFANTTFDPALVKKQRTDVVKEVKLNIDYPEFAAEQLIEGTVFVSFKIDDEGSINIEKIHSAEPSLQKYVQDELANLKIKQNLEIDITYETKFTFKLM
jgi:hypothetical protein